MAGTVVRVRGLKQYRHPKTGILYTYHRASGKRILAEPGTPEFMAEVAALDADEKARNQERLKPSTLGGLIQSYKTTDPWNDLAPRTKRDYERVIAFLAPLYAAPVVAFTAPHVAALRNSWRKTRGRRFVNYCLTFLSVLMKRHAIELGLTKENAAAADRVSRVKRDRNAEPLNRPWTEAERHAVWNRTGTARYAHLRLPVAIGLYLGIREGDMVRMPPTVVKGRQIVLKTAKRQVWIDLVVLPELAEAISASRSEAITLCVNSRGRPWSQDGFRASFFKMIRALEEEGQVGPGLTYHGLRHTVASLLAERDVSAADIAAVLGQERSETAEIYAKRADRRRRAKAAITKLRPLRTSKK